MTVPHHEKLVLADELLADIELSRFRGQALLMKANRLALLLGNADLERFIRWELHSYPAGDDAAIEMMTATGRLSPGAEVVRAPLANVIIWGNSATEAVEAVTYDALPDDVPLKVLFDANRVPNRQPAEGGPGEGN